MERTSKAVVLPVDRDWSDIGSWAALWNLGPKDQSGNVNSGDVMTIDTVNSYIRGEKMLIATLGVKDLVIVEAGDAVMVADRNSIQDRLENPGILPLNIIGVQSGSYLAEDDIVRFDDQYGRGRA